MNRLAFITSLVTSVALLATTGAPRAAACGGCVAQVTSDITDERMLLSVSPQQTTLYDQIRYAGNPGSFAWVLPIKGTVDVGLSADVLFASFDALTATTVAQPPTGCPGPPAECAGLGSFDGAVFDTDAGSVSVTKAENVGPYATVQLHATDSSVLATWLSDNGFQIPAAQQPIIDAYVKEGFDFLAMKLLPNQGIQAMRPVRITSTGANLSLPLRMASVGTGATVGITLWVVSQGRYEPQNFPSFRIQDAELVWDFDTSQSNYTTLRAQKEAAMQNKAWEIESSLELNTQRISSVILAGGRFFGGGAGKAEDDYLPVTTSDPDAGTDGGTTETAAQVRADDIAHLFGGLDGSTVRVTRMRSDIAHAAMNVDLVLRASADQTELTNIRVVTQTLHVQCPIYQDCRVVGTGNPEDAARANAQNKSGSGCFTGRGTPNESGAGFAIIVSAVALTLMRKRRPRRFNRS